LNGLRTLVADGRANRPHGVLEHVAPAPIETSDDPFAEGNEAQTPPEVWADRPDGSAPNTPGWLVRSVPNKYPALDQSSAAEGDVADKLGLTRGMPELLVKAPAHGEHEVIINSPRQVSSLGQLSEEELRRALAAWAIRLAAHTDTAPYVHVALNEGRNSGATLPHSHAQLYALPFVPPLIARERERMRAYFEHTQGRNLVEDLLIEEVRARDRLVAIDDSAVLIAPFASSTPYRLTIIPRKPEPRFDQSEHRGAGMFSAALTALKGVFGEMPGLNLWVRSAPKDAESFTWRIEIAPRIVHPAAFELGTGVSINPVSPETAAARLRDSL
jgi:UDPglucose--hexose-1-phosphate uridylyltransferase